MTLEGFITDYGYIAILIGTFLEGETVLVLGGFAAHRGYLDLPCVILAAFVGTLFGDQLYFFLGRWRSKGFLANRPAWQAKIQRAHELLKRHHKAVIFGYRFIYGVRTVVPFVIGTSDTPARRFIILNVIGALIWAVGIGCLGYLFGQAIEAVMGDIRHIEHELMIVIIAVGLIIWLFHFYRRKISHKEV